MCIYLLSCLLHGQSADHSVVVKGRGILSEVIWNVQRDLFEE